MDSASRLILKQNEKLIKSLDMDKLKPYLEVSKIFTKSMMEDIYNSESEENLFSELPSRGPQAFSRFLCVLNEAGYTREANKLKNAPKYAETSKVRSVFYSMMSEPYLGYCLIINNIKFDLLEERLGSDVDANQLELLFKKMKFDVKIENNLTGKQMKMCLKNFAKSKILKNVDCCFVVILSHGDKNDVISGTDSYEVPKEEIQNMFNNVNCEYLRNKPKIFLYQACRGNGEDDGIESADSASKLNSLLDSSDAKKCEMIVDATDAMPFKENSISIMKKDPSMTDMFIIHSSLPDHKAYRDHSYGAWLIQDIVSVFSKDYKQQDFNNMLNTVNRKVQERFTRKGQKKQVPHSESKGIRASLHLCSNDEYEGCDITLRDYLKFN